MAVEVDVEAGLRLERIRFSDARLHAVSSRKTYSEHGFEARISPSTGHVCHSLVVSWNCSPGSAQSQAASAISSHSSRAGSVAAAAARGPPRAHGPSPCARRAASRVVGDRVHEAARDAHRVVRVLAGDRQVGLALPVGVVLVDADLPCALTGEVDRARDGDVGDAGDARRAHGLGERRVVARVEALLALGLAGRRDDAFRCRDEHPEPARAPRPSSPRRPSSARSARCRGGRGRA